MEPADSRVARAHRSVFYADRSLPRPHWTPLCARALSKAGVQVRVHRFAARIARRDRRGRKGVPLAERLKDRLGGSARIRCCVNWAANDKPGGAGLHRFSRAEGPFLIAGRIAWAANAGCNKL